LLGDPNLPIDDRTRIEEALVSGQLSASPVEKETVAQRLRREGRMEGRMEGQREGRLEGQLEGRVEALLELAQEVAPERVEELRAITDVHALQRAVFELLRR
jgi:predicted transposase YdaD